MRIAGLIAAVALSTGCAGVTVGEVGLGHEFSQYTPWNKGSEHEWRGDGPSVTLRLRRISSDGHYYCEYEHVSNLTSGWPFNGKDESWLDQASCGIRFDLNKLVEAARQ